MGSILPVLAKMYCTCLHHIVHGQALNLSDITLKDVSPHPTDHEMSFSVPYSPYLSTKHQGGPGDTEALLGLIKNSGLFHRGGHLYLMPTPGLGSLNTVTQSPLFPDVQGLGRTGHSLPDLHVPYP